MEGVKETEQPRHADERPEQQEIQDSRLQPEKEKPLGLPTFPGQVQGHPPPGCQFFPLRSDIRHRLEIWQKEMSLEAQININRDLQCITQQREQMEYQTAVPEDLRYQNHDQMELKHQYDVNAWQHTYPTVARASCKGHQTQYEDANQQQRVHAQNGLTFPQKLRNELATLVTSQPGQNQKPLHFTPYQDFDICPMGRLPYDACPWRGEFGNRHNHIRYEHAGQLIYSNFALLPANRAILMSFYNEIFLCYTVTAHHPDKLYCIVQHACKSSMQKCLMLYQYRCEICAANRYEKITETRLVGDLHDDFQTLVKQGKCVRWDAEVVKHLIGNDEINVSFKIAIAEQI
jgi:hypothetical protein